MRIVIEIDGTLQQPQVTVTPSSTTQQQLAAPQQPSGDVTNAGQAPTAVGQIAMTDGTVNPEVTAPIIAQAGDNSAGAAPNVSTT